MFELALWLLGVLWGGGLLTYFVWTKNDDVIMTRIGLFLAGLACLIPLINLMMGLLYTYFLFEDWLLDSPFRGRK